MILGAIVGFLVVIGQVQARGTENKEELSDCPKLVKYLDHLTQEKLVAKLTDPCRYDKSIRPPSDVAIPIFVNMELTHVESANQRQFTAYVMVQYEYNDSRLRYDELSPNRGDILGETHLRDKIWVPHMVIKNDRATTVMGIDAKDVLLTVSPRGNVLYAYRMIVTFYCWMNLKKFPFDAQECDLRLNSWVYNSSNILLRWNRDGVRIATNLHLNEFQLTSIATDETITLTQNPMTGNFSELIFSFKMKREIGYYVLCYFLPSFLLVCTSWVTFWLQADAGPPRAILGTATNLSLITLNVGLVSNLPKVSYVKASDIWFVVCALFILGSLAEFAFVNVIWRRKKKVELKKPTSKHILRGALSPSVARRQLRKAESMHSMYKANSEATNKIIAQNYMTVHEYPMLKAYAAENSQNGLDDHADSTTTIHIHDQKDPSPLPMQPVPSWFTMNPQEVAIWVDRKSRIVFPLAFLIFNIFYWSFVYII